MPLPAGKSLSHYRLEERIGAGGSGVVWRARDTRLDREVALKFLSDDLRADPDRLARFHQEARNIAALSHPNIVTIHAIEEIDDQVFLVMELVRGTTLDRMIPRGGLGLRSVVDFAVAIADALRAAHGAGVTHRDIKPSNMMIREDGHLKVLDFGLAKSGPPAENLFSSERTTQSLPFEQQLEGTVPYMSPEQITGQPPDFRSDLFSFGAVLYEMATGVRPFLGRTAGEVMAAILRDQPRPAIEARPGLPRELARIIGHALQKDPERRFQTALDLRNELEELQEDLSSETTHPDVRALAVLPLDDLSGDAGQAWFADGMTDLLINNLARIRALRVISRTSVMRYRRDPKPLPEIATELGVDGVVEGSVLRAGDRVRITAQLIDAARDRLVWAESYEHDMKDLLALQSRVAREIVARIEVELTPQERAQLTRTDRVAPEVHECYLRGRHLWYQRTRESVREGLQLFERAIELDPAYAPAHAGIADSYIVDGGRYLGVPPHVAYTRARGAAQCALSLDDQLAEAHTSLAAVMTDYDWDWDGADREYRRAIELNPNYATAHSWYAEHLSRMARHEEAVAEVLRVPELDPASVFSGMIVAWILYFARRYDEAREQALHTLERDRDYATCHRILGWVDEETGRYDDAIAHHTRAGDLSDQSPNFTVQKGRAYALAGRVDEARRVLEESAAASGETYVSSLDLAIIHTALGETGLALDRLEKAYEERADHLPYIKVNPRLDPLRKEPRFKALLDRMGLSETVGGPARLP